MSVFGTTVQLPVKGQAKVVVGRAAVGLSDELGRAGWDELLWQMTPLVDVAGKKRRNPVGHVLVPRGARQLPLEVRDQRGGQMRVVGLLDLDGLRDDPDGDRDWDEHGTRTCTRVVHCLGGHGAGTLQVLTGGGLGSVQVTPSVPLEGIETDQPAGQVLMETVGALHPPMTLGQSVGQSRMTLRVHVTPTRLVAPTVRANPVGHVVMDGEEARQPAVTRLQRRGHVSVCAARAQVTPTLDDDLSSSRQPRPHLVTPTWARHPLIVPTVAGDQLVGQMRGAVEHCTWAVHLRFVVGRRDGRRETRRLGARVGERVRMRLRIVHVTPVVVVGFAVARQPLKQVLVPRGAVHPSGLLIQGVGTDGHRERPHVMP